MAAAEAKYHRPCPVKLYHKYRDFKRHMFVNEYQYEFAQGMTLYSFYSPGNVSDDIVENRS